MWIIINIILLMCSAVVLFIGIQFYVTNKLTSNQTRNYVLFYSMFSSMWCLCYGIIGVIDNFDVAYILKVIGAVNIDLFNLVEVFFFSGLSGIKKRNRIVARVISCILVAVDMVTFNLRYNFTFMKLGNWTTWVGNPEGKMIRMHHGIVMVILMLIMLTIGIVWLKNAKLKRYKKFIGIVFAANYAMFFAAIPDTFLPLLGFHTVPTSGIGAAICTIVIWYGASKLNSFDINMGNVVENIYDGIDIGIFVFDLNHRIVLANPSARKLFYEEIDSGLLKKNLKLEDIFYLDNKSEDLYFPDEIEKSITQRMRAVKVNRFYSMKITAAFDDYKQPYCYVGACVDISDELEMVEKLEQANAAKTKFLTSISHEIRTPINSILGFNQIITRESQNDNVTHYADNISRAGNMLLSIVNDLLDMGNVTSGEVKLVPVEYELKKLILDTYALHALKAEEKGLSLNITNDEFIPNNLIGDDTRISQIITNLLTNAIKYTSKGCIELRLDYREKEDKMIDLYIKVSDTGMGIKEEDIPYLYDVFRRFDEEKNKHIEGTGVGLAITKNLVEAMGGSIDVKSKLGEGSTFTVIIPQKVLLRAPVGKINKEEYISHNKPAAEDIFTAPDAKILVVDDNEMNLMVFEGLVKPLKAQVDRAGGGKAAVECISQKKYDIIFMDHMMPEMDGVEVLKWMKTDKDHPNQNTPVLVMTANAIKGARKQYLDIGFIDYLVKPVEGQILEKAIKRYLPEELIIFKDGVKAEETGEPDEIPDDTFPPIDGINWGEAFKNMPDKNLLLELVKTFYSMAEDETAYLDEQYGKLDTDPEALNLYRIKVHSMKNSAALVGAGAISAVAKELEYAARDEATDIIMQKHGYFVEHYRLIARSLSGAFGLDGEADSGKRVMLNKELYLNIELIQEAMEAFDTETLNSMSLALSGYSFVDSEITSRVNKLQETIRDFDIEEFNKTAEGIKQLISQK